MRNPTPEQVTNLKKILKEKRLAHLCLVNVLTENEIPQNWLIQINPDWGDCTPYPNTSTFTCAFRSLQIPDKDNDIVARVYLNGPTADTSTQARVLIPDVYEMIAEGNPRQSYVEMFGYGAFEDGIEEIVYGLEDFMPELMTMPPEPVPDYKLDERKRHGGQGRVTKCNKWI
jgi:hypothetical protein